MRKDRLYLYTFLAITLLFIIIGGVTSKYFVRLGAEQLLTTLLETSKRETKEISALIGSHFNAKTPKAKIQKYLLESIQESKDGISYVSVFDWSGKRIAHPERQLVGTQMPKGNSSISTMNTEMGFEEFFSLVKRADSKKDDDPIEIIFLNPVPNADWIVAAHADTHKLAVQLRTFRKQFYTMFSIMGFVMVLTSVIIVRVIGSLYEKRLELKNEALESEVIGLAKLNSDLTKYQEKVSESFSQEIEPKDQTTSNTEKGKKRILTYLRNELLPIATGEIAYIYTENTITYVMDVHGKRSTTNSSLDELYNSLDPSFFYRANRQFIIAIASIDKIIRYGNNQLKLVVNPNSEIDIIIGKNKASEFKQWLNL